MPIRPYLDGHRFDPETARLLGIAFETALQALRSWGVSDPPREAVAKALIDLAKGGERDPERLCNEALKACQGAIIGVPNIRIELKIKARPAVKTGGGYQTIL
jgi:hypothetical protein